MLSIEQKAEYLINNGNGCPYCGSGELDPQCPVCDKGNNFKFQVVVICTECGEQWVEVYTMSGITD